jgi:hypothetical protein
MTNDFNYNIIINPVFFLKLISDDTGRLCYTENNYAALCHLTFNYYSIIAHFSFSVLNIAEKLLAGR